MQLSSNREPMQNRLTEVAPPKLTTAFFEASGMLGRLRPRHGRTGH